MHPTISNELAKARLADLHRQADRDRLAYAARRARRARPPQSRRALPALPAFGRRVLAMLGARSN